MKFSQNWLHSFLDKTVDTDEIMWHMLPAIKELSAKVTALEAA